MGTLVGAAAMPLVPESPAAFALFLAASIVAAAMICTAAGPQFEKKDDPRIVIDEVVGYWTAVAFVPRQAAALAAAFVLFRFFDALKPGPIQSFEKLPQGWGVVMDDVAAGVASNLVLHACLKAF